MLLFDPPGMGDWGVGGGGWGVEGPLLNLSYVTDFFNR